MGKLTFQDWQFVLGSHFGPTSVALLCAGALLAVVLSAWGLWTGPRRGYRVPLFVLRFLAIAACLVVALEPTLELREVTRIRNHVAVLIDVSRSMGVSPPSGGDSRLARVESMVRGENRRFEKWRAQGHGVDFYTVGETLSPVSAEATFRAEHDATRIAETLTEIKSRYGGRDLGGIVLLSDGIDNGRIGAGPLDPETRDLVREMGVPISAVWMREKALKDISVATVLADDFAFVRTPINLEAVIRQSGLGGRYIEVALYRDGQFMDTRSVKLEGNASEAKVSFPFTPQQPGQSVFEIRTPVLSGEALSSNNSQVFALKIIRDRVRVLHVTGRPSWDVRFLRSLMRLDPNVDLVSFFILRTLEDDAPWDQKRELSLIPFPYQEIFHEQLSSFDLLIFQNFNYGPYQVAPYLPGVRDYVMGGGALVMVGGDLSFAGGGYAGSALEPILPVTLDQGGTSEAFSMGPFRPKLTEAGNGHPVTSLLLEPRANQKRWESLPLLDGLNRVAGLAPSATALMVHPRDKASDGTPAPVLSVADVGRGRTMALATDSAWHWGFQAAGAGDDARSYQKFWENAIRWLVRDPVLSLLRVELDKPEFNRGEMIGVRLRSLHADYTPAAEVVVTLDVLAVGGDANKPVQTVEVKTASDGQSHVEFKNLPPGAYRLRGRATIDGRSLEEDKALIVRAEGRELQEVVARSEVLAALAHESGGTFFEESFGDVAIKPMREERLGRREAIEIGTHPGLMALALLLLCSEWYLRRRLGYR
jgi:uncharacterized membrane protein